MSDTKPALNVVHVTPYYISIRFESFLSALYFSLSRLPAEIPKSIIRNNERKRTGIFQLFPIRLLMISFFPTVVSYEYYFQYFLSYMSRPIRFKPETDERKDEKNEFHGQEKTGASGV